MRAPLLLSAFVAPGAGQFAQRRWLPGSVFLFSFLAALILLGVRVAHLLLANLRVALYYAESGSSEPFVALSPWAILAPFLWALFIYVLNLFDVAHAERRRSARPPPVPPPLPPRGNHGAG